MIRLDYFSIGHYYNLLTGKNVLLMNIQIDNDFIQFGFLTDNIYQSEILKKDICELSQDFTVWEICKILDCTTYEDSKGVHSIGYISSKLHEKMIINNAV